MSRRRLGVGLALIIVVAAVVGIVLAVQSPASSHDATDRSRVSGATSVQRRDLVETDTESGTLSYANTQTVYDRLSGTLTWLPAVGEVIKPGQTLFKVSGAPVTLMNGTTPAYRDLSAADSAGPDILELNRNLIALGYTSEGIVADDVWQPATTAAVEVFQESLGESPTGILSLGQIVFLPGDQIVSTVEGSLGSGGGGSGGSTAASDTYPTHSSAEFVSLTSTTPTPSRPQAKHRNPGKAHRAKTMTALLALLRAEVAQLKAETAELRAQKASAKTKGGTHDGSHGGRSGGGGSGGGSSGGGAAGGGGSSGGGAAAGGGSSGGGAAAGGGNATAILQTSSTRLIVTVDLDASKQSEAKRGEKVTVELPSGRGVGGTITAVSPVAQSSSGTGSGNGSGADNGSGSGAGGSGGNGSSSATIPVTIALSSRLSGAGLDHAAVSVNFAQAKARNVLSVPVTALLATAGGGYAVQTAGAAHKLIPVTTGLFAAGYVQVSGPGVYPGLQVTDSQG